MIKVEVAYAGENDQKIVSLEVKSDCTVIEAIDQSNILNFFPEILEMPHWKHQLGIFGEKVSENKILKAGDRIEIYRNLKLDPKEARRLRETQRLRAVRQLREVQRLNAKKSQ